MFGPIAELESRARPELKSLITSEWSRKIVDGILQKYLSVSRRLFFISSFFEVALETITMVKNVEESLKRLKTAKKSIGGTDDGMTDDEKIRAQIQLDLEEFGRQVRHAFRSPH